MRLVGALLLASVLLVAFKATSALGRTNTRSLRATATATLEGDLSVVLIHGDDGKPSTPHYTLFTTNGTRYSLRSLPGRPQWSTGMRIRITGVKTAGLQRTVVGPTSNSVTVQGEPVVVSTPPLRTGVSHATAPLVGSSPGTMAVLFVIVTMCSQAASITPSAANALFFNTPGGTTQTLQGWYQGCSMNRTVMTSSTSKVVSVTLPCSGTNSAGTAWSSTTCDTYAYTQAANDMVTANGLATLANYPYRVYILPSGTPCTYLALGQLGGGLSWIGPSAANKIQAYAHEQGHNLRLHHASKGGVEYGDYSSSMGYCCTTRCFNTANNWQLGWATPVASISATNLAPGQTQTVTIPLEHTAAANLVQIAATWQGSSSYWVAYRGSTTGYNGYDINLDPAYANKVNVYQWDGTTYTYIDFTYHLASLTSAAGSSTWTQGSLVVRVNSLGATAAVVAICRPQGATETSCGDGLDNDCDGLVDGADPDCHLPNEYPNAAVAVALQDATYTATCTKAYNTTISPGYAYQASTLLASCGPSRAGFYYSFGPFVSAGTVTFSTTGDNNCYNGGDTVLSLYDNTVPAAPTCISSNDDSTGLCSLLSYTVTAADVASGRKFLVKLGRYGDNPITYFGQAITLVASFACARFPNEYVSAAVIIPPTCSLAYSTVIPSGTPYQTTSVLTPCGTSNGIGGLYYSIGPFTAAGTLNIVTSGTNDCRSGSDTVLALYDNTAVPTSPTCISYNDDYNGGYCSFYSFQVTQAYVTSGRKFLIRVGKYSDAPAFNSYVTFGQAITFNASYTCTSAPTRVAPTTGGPPAKLSPIPAMLPSPTPKLKNNNGTKP